jgi:ABC-type nitrate/sulfonate/bicarbonate transport system ATPase subunit
MAKVQIANLKASYGLISKPVLNISSLEIASGEIVAFYGPNHTGKSTLLKILAGSPRDIHVHRGSSVHYAGQTLKEFGMSNVSYLPQRFAETIFPWMSLEKNLRLRSLADDADSAVMDEHVATLSQALGFQDELSMCDHFGFRSDGEFRRPSHLSGGQQQTLTLLRSLVPKPSILILDEPFSAIDIYKGASLRRKFLEFVEAGKFNGNSGGVTTMLVTHDLDEAVDLADRVVVLKREEGGSAIAKVYDVGTPRPGPNLDPSDADALVRRIKEDNGIGT